MSKISPEVLSAARKDVADVLTVYAQTSANAANLPQPHYNDQEKRDAILQAYQKGIVASRSDVKTSATAANTPLKAAFVEAIRFELQAQGQGMAGH